MLKFACPHCGTHYELDDSLAGRKASCEVCNGHFVIPKQETVTDLDATLPGTRFRSNHEAAGEDDFDATMANARVRRETGDLRVGDLVLKRYILTERLGAGAMGMVFKCEDQISGVQYALKTVPPEIARDDESMEAIRSNFQMVHNLKHPNIAGADFLDRDEYGAYYLIMEYAPGQSLASWLRQKGKTEFEEVCKIVAQIASALDYAHDQKILHRDIKPANIMIDENGNVKVLDFGLASKVRSSMSNLSLKAANTSGTPNYMPPEQFKAQYPRPASDQYALAVMTYEMLAGHLPFETDNFEVLRSAVINDEPEEIEGISENAWLAIKKAMSKKAQDRFESCTQFATALTKGPKKKTKKVPKSIGQTKKLVIQAQNTLVKLKKDIRKIIKMVLFVLMAGIVIWTSFMGIRFFYQRETVRKYRKMAERGDAAAQCELAYCYLMGEGIKQDSAQANYWYRKAAEQGNPRAQCRMGIFCKKDLTQAAEWYRKAAVQGDAFAQFNLGYCYETGKGVEKDLTQAVEWYRKAAVQGDPIGQTFLGNCYAWGEGVEKNSARAIALYKMAAAQGDSLAKKRLRDHEVWYWKSFFTFKKVKYRP